jgi:hypothetical protein
MSWLPDEQWDFVKDSIDKKNVARSARHARTHCGKSGGVKLPCDFMSKKELKAMSGECKSYRLNSPMSWKELRAMPEDLQIAYIKAIKEKYNPTVTAIGKMMGVERANLSKYLHSLGFEKASRGVHPWDKEGFAEWCFGVPKKEECQSVQEEAKEEISDEEAEEILDILGEEHKEQAVVEEKIPVEKESHWHEIPSPTLKVKVIDAAEEPAPAFAIPASGNLSYEGDALDILRSISRLLGGAKVALSVSWDVVEG